MQIIDNFIQGLTQQRRKKFTYVWVFYFTLGLVSPAVNAGQKGGICTSASASWDGTTTWSCTELGYAMTVRQIYEAGYRVAAIGTTSKKGSTKSNSGRDITMQEILPVLIIEEQLPPPVCQCSTPK